MSRRAILGWYLVHKWTSLVCTLFLLMLCITGLSLIFHDEIDAATGHVAVLEGAGSSGTAGLPLDTIMATALKNRPGEVPLFMAFSNDDPSITVTTGAQPDVAAAGMTLQVFDRGTGKLVSAQGESGESVVDFLLELHKDIFLGQPGMLFLGLMGLLFVVALVSGTVLYAPFMRKLDFGTLRTSRSRRLKWLDYHNLIGITALAWMTVVGVTGVINTLVEPISNVWRANDVAAMARAYAGKAPLPPARYGSLDRAMAAARRAVPGMNPQFIAFPGGGLSSKHHYGIFFQGSTPFTEHLLTTALVDAETGVVTEARAMPWYFKALSLSRPLHFGDYGGLPLKLLWTALDMFTIIVLGSGIYLWLGNRKAPHQLHVREITNGAAA